MKERFISIFLSDYASSDGNYAPSITGRWHIYFKEGGYTFVRASDKALELKQKKIIEPGLITVFDLSYYKVQIMISEHHPLFNINIFNNGTLPDDSKIHYLKYGNEDTNSYVHYISSVIMKKLGMKRNK